MKLVYTDIRTPLTQVLVDEANRLVTEGKRVFYIAPNSLSFEKEGKVLQLLDQKASFAITITRFAQMARYFTLNESHQQESLDDIGLGMLFFKVLSQMPDEELKVYARLKKDPQFIQQLIHLFHELQSAQMTASDLDALPDQEKRQDLVHILKAVQDQLVAGAFESESKLASFASHLIKGDLDEELKDLALVIDGFTRFSAEEDYLVHLLHDKGVEIIIGAYASEKAYRSSFREGNLYQASVDFLLDLGRTYQVTPSYVGQGKEDAFSRMTRILEARYDFTEVEEELSDQDREAVEIWTCNHQKEELEAVARSIRQRLYEGARYKDIRVLLGDVDAYQLQLKTIFDQYQIPFYLGKSESMAQHPLVQWVESLDRLRRYRFLTEDVINLLKTGLYGTLTREDIDHFEQYVRFAEIKGLAAFSCDFTANHQDKFDLERLNQIRQQVISPLQEFYKTKSQTSQGLLKKFAQFCQEAQLAQNMQNLASRGSEQEMERYDQVWKSFSHVLEQFAQVFEQIKVTLDDFLSILLSGMLLASYRTVPATVDVVTVQSYDLIEPLSAPYVYAIGLTQERFPKIAKDQSLLTDEERQVLNQASDEQANLQIASQDNLRKNRFVALSLFNAATKQLVLSSPILVNEVDDKMSPYLLELTKAPLNLSVISKKATASSEDMGSYQALLARLIELHQGEIDQELSKEEATFWVVAIRVLRKKLDAEGLHIPQISQSLATKVLEDETLEALYPKGHALSLSASALNTYYQNQYSYYLHYVLGLQEEWHLRPDARSHGNFLHRIFERVLKDPSEGDFDERLNKAIRETSQETEFALLYQENAMAAFSKELLLDTARATGRVLARNDRIETIGEEALFGQADRPFLTLEDGRPLLVKGKVDRIDRLSDTGALGVVDYKSSETKFNFEKFFNGLNSQLPTYLSAIKDFQAFDPDKGIFGAMYLQMTDPLVPLKDTKAVDDAVQAVLKTQQYKGLFLADQVSQLDENYEKNKAMLLSQEELDLLLLYNAHLYQEAAEGILSGNFAINPYTENGRSIAPYVEQYKSITGFEANLHLGQARFLEKLDPSQYEKRPVGDKLRQAWIEKMKEELNQWNQLNF